MTNTTRNVLIGAGMLAGFMILGRILTLSNDAVAVIVGVAAGIFVAAWFIHSRTEPQAPTTQIVMLNGDGSVRQITEFDAHVIQTRQADIYREVGRQPQLTQQPQESQGRRQGDPFWPDWDQPTNNAPEREDWIR